MKTIDIILIIMLIILYADFYKLKSKIINIFKLPITYNIKNKILIFLVEKNENKGIQDIQIPINKIYENILKEYYTNLNISTEDKNILSIEYINKCTPKYKKIRVTPNDIIYCLRELKQENFIFLEENELNICYILLKGKEFHNKGSYNYKYFIYRFIKQYVAQIIAISALIISIISLFLKK